MTSHKKQILSMVAVALAATVSANAQAPASDAGLGAYFGIQGGLNLYTATSIDGVNTNDLKSEVGGMAGLKLGYVFKTDTMVRPALEYDGYWVQSIQKIDSSYLGYDDNGDPVTIKESAKITVNSWVSIVNAIARFDLGAPLQPYAGVGVGFASGSAKASVNGVSGPSTTSTDFAWQLVAGADYAISNTMSVFAEYKFLNITEDNGFGGNATLRNNLLGVGVRFQF